MGRSIWKLGEQIAENPSVWKRMKNSSSGTSFLRAFKSKGAFGSNAMKAAVGVSCALIKRIPIPVIPDLTVALVEAAEDFVRQKHRESHLDKANSSQEIVKWSIKDLDVGDLDRYRYKVHESLEQLQKETETFQVKAKEAGRDKNICDQLVHVTTAYAYAVKRREKLEKEAEGIKAVCTSTLTWLKEVEDFENILKTQLDKFMDRELSTSIPDYHSSCDPTICVHTSETKKRFGHGKALKRAGALLHLGMQTTANSAHDDGLGGEY